MAQLLQATKSYYVDNCLVDMVTNKEKSGSGENFDKNITGFYIETYENTKIGAEAASNNNPTHLYLTGKLK